MGKTEIHGICILELRREGRLRHTVKPGHGGILQARRMDGSTRDNTEKKQGVESGPMNSSLQAGVGEKQPTKERRELQGSPQSQGGFDFAYCRGFPLTVQLTCRLLGLKQPVSQSSLQASWKDFSRRNTPDSVTLGTHLSSLFLQIHSPIISLISGSCTFSKLAGLMP